MFIAGLVLASAITTTMVETPMETSAAAIEANNIVRESIKQCESKGNPEAINWEDAKITGYPSIGLFQFQPYTWLSFAKLYNVIPQNTYPTYQDLVFYLKNPLLNSLVAGYMINDGLTSHWKVCFDRYQSASKYLYSNS